MSSENHFMYVEIGLASRISRLSEKVGVRHGHFADTSMGLSVSTSAPRQVRGREVGHPTGKRKGAERKNHFLEFYTEQTRPSVSR